jgi:hypothetical protein
MPRTAKQHAEDLQELWARADREGRDLTSGERAHVEQLIESAKSMHHIEQQMRELGGDAPSFVTRTDPNWSHTAGGPGDVFIASAGVKPESTIAMSEVVEPVKKIATTLPISDELLEDAPSIQSYLNGRLTLFISIEEERQLLRGNGTNELIGLFNRAGA